MEKSMRTKTIALVGLGITAAGIGRASTAHATVATIGLPDDMSAANLTAELRACASTWLLLHYRARVTTQPPIVLRHRGFDTIARYYIKVAGKDAPCRCRCANCRGDLDIFGVVVPVPNHTPPAVSAGSTVFYCGALSKYKKKSASRKSR